jgi:hypothetical protein
MDRRVPTIATDGLLIALEDHVFVLGMNEARSLECAA